MGGLAESEFSDRICVVKFEDLLTDLETASKRITDFLGLEWSERLLEFHRYKDALDGKINYGKPIVGNNFEKWRKALSPAELRRIEEISFPTLKEYSYDIVSATAWKKLGSTEQYFGYAHDVMATLTVGNSASGSNSLYNRLKIVAKNLVLKM